MSDLPVAAPAETPVTLLQNRTFTVILAGNMISVLGNGFQTVALGLWVLQTTGSAKAMALLLTVRIVIGILLGVVAGTVVDRVDRRQIMIHMNLIRFVLVGATAYLIAQPHTSFTAILILTGLSGVCAAFFGPAFQASLINIVGKEQLPQASSLLQLVNTLAQVIGPFLGGVVVALYGGAVALSVDAATFLIAGLFIAMAGSFASPRAESGGKRSFWAETREGLTFIRSRPVVRSVALISPMVNFFGNAIGVLLPVIAIQVWQASSVAFGTMEATFPLGFAVGAALLMAFSKRLRHRGKLMLTGISLAGVAITTIALMPTIESALPLILVMGVVMALPNVLVQVLLQTEVPPELQGRVFGTLGSVVQVASPLSIMTAGFLADMVGPVVVMAAAGVLLALSALIGSALSPGLRSYA